MLRTIGRWSWEIGLIEMNGNTPLAGGETYDAYMARTETTSEPVENGDVSITGHECNLFRAKSKVLIAGLTLSFAYIYVDAETDRIREVRFCAEGVEDAALDKLRSLAAGNGINGFEFSGRIQMPDASGGYIDSETYRGSIDASTAYLAINTGTQKAITLTISG